MTSMQPTKNAALKEWAVVVDALKSGEQILLLRKGGISEETKDFQLKEKCFYVYPTYEHQKKHLLKRSYQSQLEETLKEWSPNKTTVEIELFAEAVEDIELFDEEKVKSLSPFHIWTEQVAEERLKWKKKKPLHALLLRIYRLHNPVTIPIHDQYKGCKSWHELVDVIPQRNYEPVLSDEKFQEKTVQIKQTLLSHTKD
ncbi:DUF1802 family protein [Bacillus taeanensis]|uniref:DUF1802 domain-containing protein n=1 Tax=Bacillus taeanensis TaxID=273032 RepID=A0A366Y5B1_9BACI|nr:DUF1802 family protein [Bacillus taeanensis]RBW71401.1 hypothetical protein DS031_01245 [Bacillus taeanensis]